MSKEWLAWNQNNESEWSNMSIREQLFQWASTIKIQLSMLIQYKVDLIIISLKINLISPWYSWKITEQQSLTQDHMWRSMLNILDVKLFQSKHSKVNVFCWLKELIQIFVRIINCKKSKNCSSPNVKKNSVWDFEFFHLSSFLYILQFLMVFSGPSSLLHQ